MIPCSDTGPTLEEFKEQERARRLRQKQERGQSHMIQKLNSDTGNSSVDHSLAKYCA